jgi:hypothetical protein
VHPQSVDITLPADGWVLNFFFDWLCQMFPFHNMAFSFWNIMVDSCLVQWQCFPKKCQLIIFGRLSNQCTCTLLSCFQIHFSQLYEIHAILDIPWAEQQQKYRWCSMSSVVTHWLSIIMAKTFSMVFPVVDVFRCPYLHHWHNGFVIPFYLQSVLAHSANCVKTYKMACRKVHINTPL